MEALSDFIKNAGVFTLLHLLITVILVLVAICLCFFARKRPAMWRWLGIGLVPAVSGILLWYLRNYAIDRGIGPMGHMSPEVISEERHGAEITLLFGLTGTIVILLLTLLRQRLNTAKKA
ncbi:MAG TPA: hypothetical protein VFZ40_08845 [Pyrinomonadaceae bacterium]